MSRNGAGPSARDGSAYRWWGACLAEGRVGPSWPDHVQTAEVHAEYAAWCRQHGVGYPRSRVQLVQDLFGRGGVSPSDRTSVWKNGRKFNAYRLPDLETARKQWETAKSEEKQGDMGKINSRAKGKRGELLARDLLRRYGFQAERGQQRAGGADSQDLRHNINGWHFEVKAVERLNLEEAMDQARRDCGAATPCVLHKRNGRPWLATIPAETLLILLGGQDFSDL